MRRAMLVVVALVPLTAHADLPPLELGVRAGASSSTATYSERFVNQSGINQLAGAGPVLQLDAGVRLSPSVSLFMFGSVATFAAARAPGEPSTARRWVTTLGAGARLHWRWLFAGGGFGLADHDNPPSFVANEQRQWASGLGARAEVGVTLFRCWRVAPELAVVASVAWLGTQHPDASPQELVELDAVAGVRF
jgi:hypothetical protein